MKVSSVKEAWELANRLFPTDYEKDEERSSRAGYPIHHSTAKGVNAWISDLGNRLELNYADGKSENIWIEQDKPSNLSYKIFITDSGEAASLIARGLQNTTVQNFIQASYGSVCTNGNCMDAIPDIYKKPGKFFAIMIYKPENGENPEYELTLC